MFTRAYTNDGKTIFYFDVVSNKYVACGGSLAWRLNNPGLVQKGRSIGHFDRYAIFASPEEGHTALGQWLKTKTYFNGTLKTIAKHYQPNNVDDFAKRLSYLINLPILTKIKSLNPEGFEKLLLGIEKLCGYTLNGDEKFYLLPKIFGKIEQGDLRSSYLLDGNLVLSKQEVITRVQSNLLDAVIVHEQGGQVHLRSRPNHILQHIRLVSAYLGHSISEEIPEFIRSVGTAKPGQCIWAFVNGIQNTKEDALDAVTRISNIANGERVLSLHNDTKGWWGSVDFGECIILKASLDLPIIARAVKFLQYLLTLEKGENTPIIVFAHSQGAIIMEHALALLKPDEALRIRAFTLGGGSFIAKGKSHPDSHNYASATDFIPAGGSPNWQLLALERYYSRKAGHTDEKMYRRLALRDATLEIAVISPSMLEKMVEARMKDYQQAFANIDNITIVDPGDYVEHSFIKDCYQSVVQKIVQKYRKNHG